MPLPRLGQVTRENQNEVFDHLDGLAKESQDERARWDDVVEECYNLFLYSDDHTPNDNKVRIPLTQNAVVAITDIQTKQPPTPSIEPVESGEPADSYWNGPEERGLMLLPPEYVIGYVDPADPLSVAEPLPIPPDIADQLKANTAPPELMPVLQPGFIRPGDIVELDDRTCSDALQTVHDVIRERSRVDQWIRKNRLSTNIGGTGFGLYEWDDQRKQIILTSLPITQVHFDPTAASVSDAAYVGFDMPMDADKAKAMYPDLAVTIELEADSGRPSQAGSTTTFSAQHDRDYQRKTVTFRVFWLRHQPIPMTEDEALEAGAVEQREVVDEPIAGTEGAPQGDPAILDSMPDAAGEATPQEAGIAPAPASRLAYVLSDTDEEVTPASNAWPTRTGIRQLTTILGAKDGDLVDDREVERIPLLHQINIPQPTPSPWGLGEPMRCKGMQKAVNRGVNSMVRHVDFFGNPLITMPESVHKRMSKEYKSARAEPGRVLIVPDNIAAMFGGKIDMVHQPPPMSDSAMNVTQMLKGMIDESTGNTPTLRGTAPSAQASGKMVELLQSSGVAMMGFKAQSLVDLTYDLTQLILLNIKNHMSVEDVYKIVSKLKPHVLAKVMDRWQSLEWNVRVRDEAGAEVQKQQKLAMVQVLMPLGLIDPQTASEWLNLDYRVVRERTLAHQQWLASQGGLMSQQPGQEQGNGDEREQPPA